MSVEGAGQSCPCSEGSGQGEGSELSKEDLEKLKKLLEELCGGQGGGSSESGSAEQGGDGDQGGDSLGDASQQIGAEQTMRVGGSEGGEGASKEAA